MARARGLIVVLFVFAVSRLLFQPVSLGVSTVSLSTGVVSRAAASIEGKHFNAETLGNGMPLLDRQLLLHDFWRSIWYLHAQPPLFNAFVAAALRLPGDFARNYQWINWILGLALYAATFLLMRVLKLPEWIAVAATVLFMLNPNAMWMESAVYYGLPLALMLVLAALAWNRAIATGSARWLAIASILVALLPLTRAFFTFFWCALLLAAFALVFVRRHRTGWTKPVAATLLPFLVLVAFQVKQYAVFDQFLGSSWFGCNLATMTATMSGDKARALAEGKVSPMVNVYRNAPPEVFLKYFHVTPTGVPALDAIAKSTGQPNFNHSVYLQVGSVYLHDTLYLIARHPLKYALNVINSVYIFSGYQIHVYFDQPKKFLATYSWGEIAAPLIGFPLLVFALWAAVRALRAGDERRPLIAFLLFNILYVIAVSCLFEKSEGPLYRFQVDAFIWTFIAAGAELFLRQWSVAARRAHPVMPLPLRDVRN